MITQQSQRVIGKLKTKYRKPGLHKSKWRPWKGVLGLSAMFNCADIPPYTEVVFWLEQAKTRRGKGKMFMLGKRSTPLQWWKEDDHETLVIMDVARQELDPRYPYVRAVIKISGADSVECNAVMLGCVGLALKVEVT